MAVTYQDITVSPYEFQHIHGLRIVKEPNEHSKLYLIGTIPEEVVDKYVETMDQQTYITVSAKEKDETKVLFIGIITKSAINARMNVREMEIEALSSTYMMDTQKKSRSFQDCGMTYYSLISNIVGQYPQA